MFYETSGPRSHLLLVSAAEPEIANAEELRMGTFTGYWAVAIVVGKTAAAIVATGVITVVMACQAKAVAMSSGKAITQRRRYLVR
jgi:hypothetical protein